MDPPLVCAGTSVGLSSLPSYTAASATFTQLAATPVAWALFSHSNMCYLMLCNRFQRQRLAGSTTGNRAIYWFIGSKRRQREVEKRGPCRQWCECWSVFCLLNSCHVICNCGSVELRKTTGMSQRLNRGKTGFSMKLVCFFFFEMSKNPGNLHKQWPRMCRGKRLNKPLHRKTQWSTCLPSLPQEFSYTVPMVVFLLDWIMATHLKISFHHQSMRKWGVNTLVLIQHSFIYFKTGSPS